MATNIILSKQPTTNKTNGQKLKSTKAEMTRTVETKTKATFSGRKFICFKKT